ncbi:unnamed protein product [Chilo suppressalis]|uniref:Peptidase S1 domain-containing protein n=1 Tax=Chilo suppressalis TaxID=168631 RepID=A0ABN8LAD2_CHISP|nr:unnamed protein product [Chilo suppressalis]
MRLNKMIRTLLLILIFSINHTANEPDKRVLTTLKYSKKYARPSVVNGVPAKWGQVPYIVSIKEPIAKVSKLKSVWTNICGGSIIGPTKVLTAAHCFESRNFYYKKHPHKLRVVAGEFLTQLIHTGNTCTTETFQWRRITKVATHPDFYFPDNDIAVARVNQPWVYKDNVDFILPAVRGNIEYPVGCTAAGFGSISHTKGRQTISPVLLVGQMFLLPKKNCSWIWEMDMDNFICTYSYMSDVSHGDSGGPLVCKGSKDPAERRLKRNALLVGVVSGKNFDKTSIFTRVAAYHDWIDKNLAQRARLSVITLTINYVLFSF